MTEINPGIDPDGDVLTPIEPAPTPTGRGRKTATTALAERPAPAAETLPATIEDADTDEGQAQIEHLAIDLAHYVPDPRPAALVAAANYYAGANVPDQLIIDKARRFERYLLEPRGEDWKPVSKKARKAATEAEAVQA